MEDKSQIVRSAKFRGRMGVISGKLEIVRQRKFSSRITSWITSRCFALVRH